MEFWVPPDLTVSRRAWYEPPIILGYCTMSLRNWWLMFQDSKLVPSSRSGCCPFIRHTSLDNGTITQSWNIHHQSPMMWHGFPEEWTPQCYIRPHRNYQ